MRPGKIVAIVVGALAILLGLGAAAGGTALVWAHTTQRDADGFYATATEQFQTNTYALTSDVDFGDLPGEHDWTIGHAVGTVRLRVSAGPERAVFVGIAPTTLVDRWLSGSPHEHVTGDNFSSFKSSQTTEGGSTPGAPGEQSFWVASTSGTGMQTLLWPTESGRWTVVVMNADGSRGVTAAVSVGAKTGVLLAIGIGLGVFALFAIGIGALLLVLGLRGMGRPAPEKEEVAVGVPIMRPEGAYPARLNGHLDPQLSRWLWLVKWILVIPHFFVLVFLWVAVAVLTVVAGFAILFTGRYPRQIFDFNVGVMRWTWRVSFYALSAFGTDKYPPFSLHPDPSYPADFDVDYPEQLSRGLVLVKWWLLALPHYLIVAIFAGGWGIARDDAWRVVGSGGLIALLAIIAVVVLAVKGRYPESIFEFVMGLNRWCYRVLAYAALMRDDYPPFRLDSGGTDPGTIPDVPPEPLSPDRTGELAGTAT